ncbi:hypothetical protein ACE1OE_18805 [Vibrio sp. E150_011]
MLRVVMRLAVMVMIITSPRVNAQYIAELNLMIRGVYQGKVEIGLQDRQVIKLNEITEVILYSQSSVSDDIATLHFVVVEQSLSYPQDHNQLVLPTMITEVNSEAGVEIGDEHGSSIHYQVVVRKKTAPSS